MNAPTARQAATLIDPARLDPTGSGEAVLLWRDEHSEAWLDLWWQPRDTGGCPLIRLSHART